MSTSNCKVIWFVCPDVDLCKSCHGTGNDPDEELCQNCDRCFDKVIRESGVDNAH